MDPQEGPESESNNDNKLTKPLQDITPSPQIPQPETNTDRHDTKISISDAPPSTYTEAAADTKSPGPVSAEEPKTTPAWSPDGDGSYQPAAATEPAATLPAASQHSDVPNVVSSETHTATPVVSGDAPVVGTGGVPVAATISKAPRRNRRTLLVVLVAVLLLLGLGSGYVFGYYIPNKPENVWKDALVNTGKGYDMLTSYATAVPKDVQGLDMQGSYKVNGAIISDGTMTGKSQGSDSQFTGSISAVGLKINYDVRSIKSSGDTPDYYFKVSGIQGLGDLVGGGYPGVAGALNGLNNQWYVIDHTLFQQLAGASGSSTSQQYGVKDVQNTLNTVGVPNKTYLFTNDASKAVFVQKSYVGAEKRDGRSTYHYKAGVDKTHLKSYLQTLCDGLSKDKLGKLVLNNGLASTNCTDFAKRADSVDASQTADVWVDRHTKLVHAVRFSDKKDAANYFEITQDYQGGSSYPFGLTVQTKDSTNTITASLTGSLDSASNTLKINGKLEAKGDQASTGSFDFTIKPNTDKSFKVTVPDGAKNIMQLLNDLGVGQLLSGDGTSGQPELATLPGVQSKARDSERRTDINALDSHIEAYYAQYGKYPTLSELNNAAWLSENMLGLDPQVLQDPQGTSSTLVSSPKAGAYAYQVDSAGTQFTLTATLEDGTSYVKTSLTSL